jgi:MFS family permease
MSRQLSSGSILGAFRGSEAFLILCVQVAVIHVGYGLITPILPFYAQTFGVSVALVGFLITAEFLPRIFVNLPAGRYADKWGSHRLLAGGAGIVAVAALLAGLAPNYGILLFARLLQGFGSGISMTAGHTYAVNVSTPQTRARYISLFQSSFLIGTGIGPTIGGITAQWLGYQAPFFVFALLAAVVGVWMYIRLPDSRGMAARSGTVTHSQVSFRGALRRMMLHPGVLMVSLIGLMGGFTRAASRNMAIPLQGGELGLSEGEIGLMMSLLYVMTVGALALTGTFGDRFGRKAILVPGQLVMALSLVLIALVTDAGPYMIGVLVYGMTIGVGGPIPAAYIADAADEEMQGMAIGVYRTSTDAGSVLGPIIVGWVIDHTSLSTGLVFNASLLVIVAVAFWVLTPEPRVKEQPG